MTAPFYLPKTTEHPTRDHIGATEPGIPQQVAALGPRYPVLVAIIEASALAFGLQPDDLLSDYRGKSVVEARMVACLVARRCTRMSFPQIGKEFGRDHTTVMSACQRIERLCQCDEWLRAAVAVLLERFGATEEVTKQ